MVNTLVFLAQRCLRLDARVNSKGPAGCARGSSTKASAVKKYEAWLAHSWPAEAT